MAGTELPIARLAETEYAMFRDPATTTPTPFGTFICDPAFPTRYDCNQLFDCRCAAGEVDRLLGELDRLYAGRGLPMRKLSGHDPATRAVLEPVLARRGWTFTSCRMMPFRAAPVRPVNPAVEVRAVDPFDPALEAVYTGKREPGVLDRGFLYHRTHWRRLGGEWLVGFLDGEPAGTTGWFVADGLARFRWVGTREEFRGRHVATTLIRHVQDHPLVRRHEGLVIYVNDDGPVRLYEQLGFRTAGMTWEAMWFAPGADRG